MSSGRAEGRRFDRDHGVTTQAIFFLNDLDPELAGDAAAHATHYEAVPVGEFHDLMRAVPPAVIPASAFVDAGAGMGRALLLASLYPFRSILGIEVSPALFEIARENVERAHSLEQRCRNIHIVRDDARIARYPSGGLVLFLYNPFDAQALATTIDALMHEREGAVHVLYHTPVEEHVLRERGFVELCRTAAGAAYVSEPKSAPA